MTLLNDIARCKGNNSDVCKDCLRRLVIQHDDGAKYYIADEADDNECMNKIEAVKR